MKNNKSTSTEVIDFSSINTDQHIADAQVMRAEATVEFIGNVIGFLKKATMPKFRRMQKIQSVS